MKLYNVKWLNNSLCQSELLNVHTILHVMKLFKIHYTLLMITNGNSINYKDIYNENNKIKTDSFDESVANTNDLNATN